MGKSFSDYEIEYIKTWYGRKTATEIGEDLGRTMESIYHKAKRLKLQHRKLGEENQARKPWSKEEEKFLIENYSTMLNSSIVKELGRSQDAIHLKAIKLGLTRGEGAISLSHSYAGNRVNHNYFKEWSPNMAYILGMIYADGCLSDKHYRITISLKCDDGYLLEKIRDEIESDNQVVVNDKTATLHFSSISIKEDLMRIGLTPNKSLIITFPEIPMRYMSHFIRGYFDGDGTISHNKDMPRIAFYSGSKVFLEKLNKEISLYLNIEAPKVMKVKRDAHTHAVYYGGLNALDLAEWMYKDSDLKLKRKYERWLKHEENYREKYNDTIFDLYNGITRRGVLSSPTKPYRRYTESNSPFWPRGIYRKLY